MCFRAILRVRELLPSLRDGVMVGPKGERRGKKALSLSLIQRRQSGVLHQYRLASVGSVGFETRSPTSAGKDLRRRNWQLQCGERERESERKRGEAVGGQAQTDEPYLGRACVSSPSTPACPGAPTVCLSFQLRRTRKHSRACPHAHTHIDTRGQSIVKMLFTKEKKTCTSADMHFCLESPMLTLAPECRLRDWRDTAVSGSVRECA